MAAVRFNNIYSGHSKYFEEFSRFKPLITQLEAHAKMDCFLETVIVAAYMLIHTNGDEVLMHGILKTTEAGYFVPIMSLFSGLFRSDV